MNRLSMMEQVHLGGEDEEDIYGGFNDYNATLDTDVSRMIYEPWHEISNNVAFWQV